MRLNRCSTTFQFWAVGTRPVKTTISPTISSAVSSWYRWTWGRRPSIMHHVGHPLTVPALHSRLAALKFAKRRINEYPTTRPDSSRETWRYFQVFSGHLEEDGSSNKGWGVGWLLIKLFISTLFDLANTNCYKAHCYHHPVICNIFTFHWRFNWIWW